MSLTLHLRLLAVLVVVFVGMGCGIYWWQLTIAHDRLRAATLEQTGQRAAQLADAIAEEMEAVTREIDVVVRQLREQYTTGNVVTFAVAVRTAEAVFPAGSVLQIGIIDNAGHLAYTNLGASWGIDLSDREHFRAHLGTHEDRLFIGAPVFGRISNRWTIQFTRPIFEHERFSGVIVFSVAPEYFARYMEKLKMDRDDVITLIRSDGPFLARSKDLAATLGKTSPADRPFMKPDAPPQGVYEAPGAIDKIDRVFAWHRLENYPMTIFVGLAKSAALAAIDEDSARSLQRNGISIVLIMVLAVGTMMLLLRSAKQQDVLAESEIRYRALEHASREASQYARSLLEASLDPLVAISAEGKITDVNTATEKVTGVSRVDLVGSEFADYFTDPAKAREGYQQVFAQGYVTDYPLAIRNTAGTITDVLYNASVYHDENGNVRGVFAAARDITARKAAELEILRLNTGLERRVRQRTASLKSANDAIESFSYSIAHDLRTPLRGIAGYTRMIEEDYAEYFDQDGKAALQHVQSAAMKMGELIEALLTLSQVGHAGIQMEAVDLSALAHSVADTLKAGDPARSVTVGIAPQLAVRGDKRLLRSLLENLFGNAWKFTAKCTDARIELGVTQKGGNPAYFVRDNGAGFDMAHAAQLFRPFHRLHASEYAGTGIGLATVRRIVERHGGRVWAEGAVEQGATFFFTLSA